MEIFSGIQEHPDVSAEERAASELIKRIRKLRWMGMDEEAQQMQVVLRRAEPGDTLLAGPWDTD